MAFIAEYISFESLFTFVSAVVSLEIGVYLVVMEFIGDMINDTRLMNETAKAKKNQTQISTTLSATINFHMDIKQLSLLTDYYQRCN